MTMTHRERILAAIRGETPDRLPFVPRLEFWYRARRRKGTLPGELRSLTLMEIADRLGAGYYAATPDFTEYSGDVMADRALGLPRLAVFPHRVTLQVERRVLKCGQETVVEYQTPFGTVRTATVFTEEMLDAGASDPWVAEHAIREPRHFRAVGYIFSHLRVEPQTSGYLALRERVGDRGIVVAVASGNACPVQHIMAELMSTEQFFYALHDCPAEIEQLAEAMEPFYDRVKVIAAASPAEVILLGSNYDDSITHPVFFRKYILPALRDYAGELHRRGKYLLTHADGENRRLLPLYLEAGLDVAESVCPYPMTRCRLEEILEAFAGRITVWGGIPSVLLCSGSASFEQFRIFADAVVDRFGHHGRLILGVSDMVTADADWDRVQFLAARVAGIR